MVLTYVALVGGGPSAANAVVWRRVDRHRLSTGSALSAPIEISTESVVEHALRHLAWLLGHDEAVRRALPDGWSGPLASY